MENKDFFNDAIQKIDDGIKKVTGQKEKVMAEWIALELKDFCWQDAEFAQAIVQGGSFPDCMHAVANGVGSSISDMDACQKAVQFYFPGAKIKMQMTIDLIGDAAEQEAPEKAPEEAPAEEPKNNTMYLDLTGFF